MWNICKGDDSIMAMIDRAQSAFDEIIKAMGENDSQLLKRDPDVKKLIVDIVRIVERARDPESWPVVSFPDNYADTHPSDSKQWIQLMTLATLQDDELASILCYLRGTGCVLMENDKYGYVIQPVIGNGGWASQAEYDKEKKPLASHGKLLMELLKKVRNS